MLKGGSHDWAIPSHVLNLLLWFVTKFKLVHQSFLDGFLKPYRTQSFAFCRDPSVGTLFFNACFRGFSYCSAFLLIFFTCCLMLQAT